MPNTLLKPRVLVAEDDAGVRDIIRTRLQIAGYEVTITRTGIEALASVRGSPPDAMVLDINMPEMDGFTVLQTLKAAGIKPPPTLVLTARHAADDVRRAIALGAKDYLTKPFSEGQLLARMARLLRPPQPVKEAPEVLL